MRSVTRRPGWWLVSALAAGLAAAGCTEVVPDEPEPTGSAATPSPGDAAAVEASVVSIEAGPSGGSGVVVSADGHIVTTHSVVAGADSGSVTVTLSGGDSHQAAVVGSDPRTDLAVIQVDGVPDLAPAGFADSDAVEIGDEVRVLGGPLVRAGPITSGVVSATGAVAGNISVIEIETEAAAVPGSGGGPAVNTAGEIIGIAIATRTSGDAEISVAVPSNLASRVADQLIAGEEVAHPYLGVSLGDADGGGALVEQVAAGSPAAEAGLASGDVITTVGDRTVDGPGDVVAAVQSHGVGDEVTLTYTRDGSEQDTTVTLNQAPAD
jgi:putative serine protease PepD